MSGFYFDPDEAEDLIGDLYSIDTSLMTDEQADAISKAASWLVLMLQEADDGPERGQ